jgi:hypothetical protein
MADHPAMLDEFLGKLVRSVVAHEGRLRVVVCMRPKLVEMLAQLNVSRGAAAEFLPIKISPLSDAETTRILEHLPEPARQLALARIDQVTKEAKGLPRRVQFLCENLWRAVQANSTRDQLRRIIDRDDSYRRC